MKRIDEGGKVCRKCGVYQPRTEFYIHRTGADGHFNHCKACARDISDFAYRKRVKRSSSMQLDRTMAALRPEGVRGLAAYLALPVVLRHLGDRGGTVEELAAIIGKATNTVTTYVRRCGVRAGKRGRQTVWKINSAQPQVACNSGSEGAGVPKRGGGPEACVNPTRVIPAWQYAPLRDGNPGGAPLEVL